jgi:GNAT superfamily N-acetyltransferase
LYAIALATGASGGDAARLHDDPRLIGHIYAAPYALFSRQCSFVAQDASGVAGYFVGAVDTRAFEALLETSWWPGLRTLYADPSGKTPAQWTADDVRAWQIHHPRLAPERVAGPYPSHLHINLLPRLQGQGVGRVLIETWLARVRSLGSTGAHLGVDPANARAMRFYPACGWRELKSERPGRGRTAWFVREL